MIAVWFAFCVGMSIGVICGIFLTAMVYMAASGTRL